MGIKFGPAGLGSVKDAGNILEEHHKKGLRACEVAFTYGVYVKKEEDALEIGKLAKEFNIELSVHAPYWVNLNSDEKEKREATKKRILDSCRIGEIMGAKVCVFHPGFYGSDKEGAFGNIKKGILEMMKVVKSKKWKIKLAPETMGKVNVFGSVEEIARLVKETGCSFCLDFAHVLARNKEVDFDLIERLFPQEKWHCHFSGIVYGEKGEKHHRATQKKEWSWLLKKLPRGKEIVIINEAPDPVGDSIKGLRIYKEMLR